jgi:hypothetical protein
LENAPFLLFPHKNGSDSGYFSFRAQVTFTQHPPLNATQIWRWPCGHFARIFGRHLKVERVRGKVCGATRNGFVCEEREAASARMAAISAPAKIIASKMTLNPVALTVPPHSLSPACSGMLPPLR